MVEDNILETKPILSDVIPIITKITDNKFDGSSYLEWSKTVCIYLRSIDKDDHLTKYSPTNASKQIW